jgi:diguanylate cyclase (GGDEF)-like protein
LPAWAPIGPAAAPCSLMASNIAPPLQAASPASASPPVPVDPKPLTTSLTEAIGKSERIREVVEECATELFVVNTVLKEQLDRPTAPDEVARAVRNSDAVEAKVQDSADELTALNHALVVEVRERQLLEHQLTASRAQEHAARHAAFHDSLTSLANRVLFNDRLEHGLAQAKRHGWTIVVMFMDLDNFKVINDTHGHEVGDQVLKTIAGRLQTMTREDDTVSRHGGDEFLNLFLGLKSRADAAAIATKIVQSLSRPCDVLADGTPGPSVTPSIGIALYPADALTADDLVKCADKAMYRAKRERSGFAFSADPEVA